MGKKGLSDKVRNKQKNKAKPAPNPFEVKINKVKHAVVNKKLQKWEKGIPGVSRSKAIKKRKDTILKELYHMKKANTLLDKRFGESDSTLTADEKMVQRFALEKKKQIRKSDFNLNEEEEVLTHYGQSLAENLQDTIGSDSDDEEDRNQIKTGDFQFGGFSKDGEVSWKDKMKEVIAESKKHKYERQAEKEKTLETTNELDMKWKSIVPSLNTSRDNLSQRKVTNFMQLFRTLVLDQKSSGASDKFKTEEEKAKEEAEKLQILEAERLSRMAANSNSSGNNHVSADDLCDGFTFDNQKDKSSLKAAKQAEDEEEDGDKEKVDETEEDDDQEEGSDEEEEEDDDESSEESDDYSDLASDDNSGSDEDVENEPSKHKNSPTKKAVHQKVIKDKAPLRDDLPFVFAAPGSYEELKALLHGHSADEQVVIISRLRKCHHPSLAEGNKDKLEKIHLYLLQYFGELMKQEILETRLIDNVTASLWEMSQTFPASTAKQLQEIVTERQKDYSSKTIAKGGRGTFVGLDTLMYLKLIESLFPTSDFKHPVTTPAIHFITQMLSECSVKRGQDVVVELFLISLALKYVSLSKRYIPEVVTSLHGLLFLASGKSDLPVYPPFRATLRPSYHLKLQQKSHSITKEWSISEMLNTEASDLDNDQFRCDAIHKCLVLLENCLNLWGEIPCLSLVLRPVKASLLSLPKDMYPNEVQEKVQLILLKMNEAESKKIKVMQKLTAKPVPLKLFEPQIEEFWAGKKKKKGPNKEENERKRLSHKYKREMKAAVREIKRDNEVLSKHQLDVVIQKDTERKRKTKELMSSLASQEGDFKALKKIKKE